MKPFVSVIIPSYNCKSTLKKTVDSILKCGLRQFEILLVDDGSTDETLQVCRELAAQSPIITYTHQQNQGVSEARNQGLRAATGDYIWFFDSDDFVDPGSLAHVVQILDDRKPDLLIFGMTFDSFKNDKLCRRTILQYDKEE